jgi:hypothetical protein
VLTQFVFSQNILHVPTSEVLPTARSFINNNLTPEVDVDYLNAGIYPGP